MIRKRALAAAGLAILACTESARTGEPVRVLSGGALEPAVAAALAAWRESGGAEVAVSYATAPRIAERLAGGERPDLVLAPVALLDGLASAGRLGGRPVALGSVGVGVAVRDGAPVPVITDEASFRAEVLAADAVVFNRASTGSYVEGLLNRIGLAEALAARTIRFPDGDAVLRRIAAGTGREIAFAASTEISLFRERGVRSAGPLPAPIQNRTPYAAGLLAGTAPGAEAFLLFLDTAPCREAMARAGVD